MKEIPLSQGKVATVDDEDFDRVNRFIWCASKNANTFYAYRNLRCLNGKKTLQALHQFLMPGGEIDHIDGDGLNNRKVNLRPASRAENAMNSRKRLGSSRYKGVFWYKRGGCWESQITIGKKNLYLGRFEDEADAAHVYDYAAKIYFGEFARLNFP